MQPPCGSDGKESACNAGDPSLIPGSVRYHGEGNGYPLQYSCLENSMDRGTWWVIVHGSQRVRHYSLRVRHTGQLAFLGAFQVALVIKNPPANAGSIKDRDGGHGNPFQYSCLETPMDRGAWWGTVHRVAKSLRGLKWMSRHTVDAWKGKETFFSRALLPCPHHPGKKELNYADTLISAQWDQFWTPWPPELKDNMFVLF